MDEASIVAAALQKAPAERSAFVEQACGGDEELRRRVEALLEIGKPAGGSGAIEPPADALPPTHGLGPTLDLHEPGGHTESSDRPGMGTVSAKPGTRIGPYSLLQKLGEGGIGVVYLADQERPVRRKVALKIIKPGMDSQLIVARFEAERQALAMMDHPNIARVLDAGSTETGRPYFVMEPVHGVPITRYCDSNPVGPRERLELFIPVCRAIQHAHQKGIIHRDLKPSNVLVALDDGRPVPKVIDFGVAKAIDQPLTERTMVTQLGSIIGTFEYMSPEQAELGALDIDTRSDIYSLGVLLYELLTGTTPLEGPKLRRRSYAEILRRVREEEPPKPSVRLSEAGAERPSVATGRRIHAAGLTKLARGELDWVVMKALEKDRNRRYETVGSFADDIRRYLDGDPVEAGRPSAAYRLRKLARKHRGALAMAGAFAFVLVLAAAVSTELAIRARRSAAEARRQARAAEDQRNRAVKAEQTARDEEARAKAAAAEAHAVLEFVRERVLAAARPQGQAGGLGKDVTLRAAVDRAESGIAASFPNQPAVEAAIRDTIGESYWYLGEPALSVRQHERALHLRRLALGPDHRDTLTSMQHLAEAYTLAGRNPEALTLVEEAVRGFKARLGAGHPDTLNAMDSLAGAYWKAGRIADALPVSEETFQQFQATRGPDHPETLGAMSNLAMMLLEAGRLAEATSLFETALQRYERARGPAHPDTLALMCNLANAYRKADRFADAVRLLEEAVKQQKDTLGPDHPDRLNAMSILALTYRDAGRIQDAVPLLEDTLKRKRATLGANHPETLPSVNNLAMVYQDAGRLAEALPLYEETLRRRRALLGAEHPSTLNSMNNLATAYHDAGRLAEALPLLQETLQRRQAKLGREHPDTLDSMTTLGRAHLRSGRPVAAEVLLRECLATRERNAPKDWRTFETMTLLGASLMDQGKYAQAEPLLLQGYEGLRARQARLPPRHRKQLVEAAARVGELYDAWGQKDRARQ